MPKSQCFNQLVRLKHAKSRHKFSALGAAAGLLAGCLMTVPALAAQGTWTVVPNNPGTGGNAFGLWLLTDGSVLSHGNALNQWSRLIPGADGNYADGTWVQESASPWAMGGATERILNDGRFMETGAEYIYAEPSGYSSTDYNDVQIFDPLANAWTIGAPGLYGDIGDSGT